MTLPRACKTSAMAVAATLTTHETCFCPMSATIFCLTRWTSSMSGRRRLVAPAGRGRPRSGSIRGDELSYRFKELRGQDLNLRPRGYEPRELPGCSTPRYSVRRRLSRRLHISDSSVTFALGEGTSDSGLVMFLGRLIRR